MTAAEAFARPTAWERVRDLAATDPRAACALARELAPVAANAIIDRLAWEASYPCA